MENIIIFKDNIYREIPVESDIILDNELLPDVNGDIYLLNDSGKIKLDNVLLTPFSRVKINDNIEAVLFDDKINEFCAHISEHPVTVSGVKSSDIFVSNSDVKISIYKEKIELFSGEIYLNGKKKQKGTYEISEGDCILVGNTKLILCAEYILCCGIGFETKMKSSWVRSEINEDFPIYKRSPRIIKPIPNDNVEIQAPEKIAKNTNKLAKTIVPPLVTMLLTVVIGIFVGRGIMMLLGVATSIMTLVFSIVSFISDKKERKLKEEKRETTYSNYLLSKRQELNSLYLRQKEALLYHNPDINEISRMIENYSSRIYERAATDSDFLTFSLGIAPQPTSFKIKNQKEVIGEVEDVLEKEMHDVINTYNYIADMPVVIDLKKSHLGLVGEQKNIHKMLTTIITQICFHQSYHDVEIVTLINEKDDKIFDWIKWYPHCRVKSINISGLVSAENQRDQVLGNIAQILKERKQKQDESKQESLYLPHYVFIIDNPKLIINHSIMEYLQLHTMNLGFSIIYTTNIQANLPDNVHTIFNVDGQYEGTLLMNNGQLINKKVKLYSIDEVDFERMSRSLTPLVHNKGVSTQIPENITFFELYNVKKPSEIPVEKLWAENKCFKSLAVPLGVRAKDDIVYLNLHEKAHGPHGLVAGTTGSGKSEIVQSYILSLAINFHPYDVGFLLIDYKGGGMANLFEKLPHLLGTITNLDGSESMRALASIKSELARRQRIFNEHDVNNINQYTKLFKSGKALQPMPHLFLISDEFAELKKEQPDFMSELVSAARIGRSLGVHLILATQKPSGVVDDQIWSNSKFKLALKVQNESDSNEVIKTPDAARITQPGRAYLQVGNNEVYELFQSAWSGAEYSETVVEKGYDNRVYKINKLGQGELLNEDLSEGETEQGLKETQLDVVVDYIKNLYDRQGCKNVEKPWLPPLGNKIVSPHIKKDKNVAEYKNYDLKVTVGIVDIPENQMQVEYCHDFIKDGNFAIFGSSGFGKSTTEMNMVLELACKNSPENLNYYILDFGTSSLIQLKGLPHTADYITFDENEKLDKFVRLLSEEIKKRKSRFASKNAMNFKMYNNISENRIPAIVVFIDNYDVVREIGIEFETFITKLTRDGVAVGIYTVINASRSSAVKYSIISNFKNKICQYMFDSSDYVAVVGRSKYKLPEIKGRALTKLNDVSVMQCYLPTEYNNDEEYAGNISNIVTSISENNTAKCPSGIPMLPEVVTYNDICISEMISNKKFTVGLDTEEVKVQGLNLNIATHLIVGSSQTGKTNILKLVCKEFDQSKIFISDSKSMDMEDYANKENVTYLSSTIQLEDFISTLEAEVNNREKRFFDINGNMKLKEFCENQPPMFILIDDGDNFVEMTKSMAKRIEDCLHKAVNYGVTVISTTMPNKLRGFDNVTKILKDTQSGIVLGNPSEQNLFAFPPMRGYKPQVEKGFICFRGNITNVKIPFVD